MTFADLSPLANHLWQSTLCVAVAWLLTLGMRKNRAAARYGLWMAASVKFLIPFSLLVSAGAQLEWRAVPITAPPQLSSALDEIAQPFAAQASAPLPAVAAPALNPLPAILFAVWLGGIAIGIVFWLRCWWQVRSMRRAATPLAWNLPVKVMSSPTHREPGVFGIRKPCLLLPERIADRLTPPQLEAILAHELRHVERRDNLTAAIHMLVETIFWFHPCVWWIRARLMEERERACDEEVVRMGSEPQVYAESILKVCEFYLASPAPCAAGVTGGELKQRIESIMANRVFHKLNLAQKLLLAVAAIGAVGGPIAVGLAGAPRAQSRAQAVAAANTLRAEGPAMAVPQAGRAAQPPAASPAVEVVGQTPPQKASAAPTAAAAAQTSAQSPSLGPRFEVASVKPGGHTLSTRPPERTGGRLRWTTQLAYIIGYAYRVDLTWLSGGSELGAIYDIQAIFDPGATDDRVRDMVQSLLTERFNLRCHRVTGEENGYALVIGKGGFKIKEAKETDEPPPMPGWVEDASPALRAETYISAILPEKGVVAINGRKVTMSQLAQTLERVSQTPMWDRTGLSGNYYFAFRYARDMDAEVDTGAPSLAVALQKTLGLTLEKQKGPVERLVVDHVEPPSEN